MSKQLFLKMVAIPSIALGCAATAYAGSYNNPRDYVNAHPYLMSAMSLFAPVAFGANFGQVYGGIGLVNRYPGGDTADGSMVLGAGLGDGDNSIGADVTLLNDSLGRRTAFAKNMAVGLKLFRWLGTDTSVAVGASNLAGTNVYNHYASSYYASVTHFFQVGSYQAVFTAGAGTGAFDSPEHLRADDDKDLTPFGSVSVQVLHNAGVIADYTGQVASVGVSTVPFQDFPMVLTAYSGNLAGPKRVHGPVNFGLTASFGYSFAT